MLQILVEKSYLYSSRSTVHESELISVLKKKKDFDMDNIHKTQLTKPVLTDTLKMLVMIIQLLTLHLFY